MDISRRSFLGGTLAFAAAVAIPAGAVEALASIPRIYGDSVHDDIAGLQALFDGERVFMVQDGVVAQASAGRITMLRGTYLISDTLVIERAIDADGVSLIAAEPFHGYSALYFAPGSGTSAIEDLKARGFPMALAKAEACNLYIGHFEVDGGGFVDVTAAPPNWRPRWALT